LRTGTGSEVARFLVPVTDGADVEAWRTGNGDRNLADIPRDLVSSVFSIASGVELNSLRKPGDFGPIDLWRTTFAMPPRGLAGTLSGCCEKEG
jgi:hypothetical protein